MRKAFIPRNEDYLLMAADYSQIELRIIAALSEESTMIEAFQRGEDIHASTAARVFGIPIEEEPIESLASLQLPTCNDDPLLV